MQRVLLSIPILLQTFLLTILMWCFQEILSSKYTPKNFVTNSLLTGTSMCNGGKIFGISFPFLVEWNKEYFVSEIFKENLLALNQIRPIIEYYLVRLGN